MSSPSRVTIRVPLGLENALILARSVGFWGLSLGTHILAFPGSQRERLELVSRLQSLEQKDGQELRQRTLKISQYHGFLACFSAAFATPTNACDVLVVIVWVHRRSSWRLCCLFNCCWFGGIIIAAIVVNIKLCCFCCPTPIPTPTAPLIFVERWWWWWWRWWW